MVAFKIKYYTDSFDAFSSKSVDDTQRHNDRTLVHATNFSLQEVHSKVVGFLKIIIHFVPEFLPVWLRGKL